jgi:hypothetical protein
MDARAAAVRPPGLLVVLAVSLVPYSTSSSDFTSL